MSPWPRFEDRDRVTLSRWCADEAKRRLDAADDLAEAGLAAFAAGTHSGEVIGRMELIQSAAVYADLALFWQKESHGA